MTTLPQNSGLIIQGSSRGDGNTAQVVETLTQLTGFEVLKLHDKNIGQFDYTHQNKEDEFLPLMRLIASRYSTIVFATPVYWYAMSGCMKVFFDRLTDCLTIEKETGRKLRGKNMAMLSCSNADDLFPEFKLPFELTARYLGMNYLGEVHTWLEKEQLPGQVRSQLEQFAGMLRAAAKPIQHVN